MFRWLTSCVGVVGLPTALKAQEAGHIVIIIASELPGDPKSTHYTSPWAGAHHISEAAPDDTFQRELDVATFHEFWKMSAPESDAQGCFMRLDHTEFYSYKHSRPAPLELLQCLSEFRYLNENELIPEAQDGMTFKTVTIDTAVYLPFLLSKFLGRGGRLIRARVQHIDQVIAGAFTPGVLPDAVFICTGIGARSLGGVEDTTVYPIRGQTVVIRAPWVKFGRAFSTGKLSAYIIPRRSGDVVLGGIKGADDWYPLPRPEMADDILQRTLAIAPELAPPEAREGGRTPTVEDLKKIVIEHGCGFRPARKGGIRLEREWREVAGRDRKVAVIHNYGHGSQGYQSSWGSAEKAISLLGDTPDEL
ncbi:D-amino-acid oxidase [Auriculariales sp. MPI-PUGE-AT-0066]|nr:D-amino-acid oxidase [Auriculariales sp. MPI-PUGE-AT-0066]